MEASVLERCRAGDERAWGELVREFAGLVYAIARRHSLSASDCDDVAQGVFSQLARGLHAIREPAALPGWISTTARRESIRVRKSSRATRDLPASAAAPAEADLDELERHRLLRLALDELGGRCRDLLRELYFAPGEPDYAEIARRLGIPIGSIGPTRNRCLAKLASLMNEKPARE